MPKTLVLMNPNAGRGHAAQEWPKVDASLRQAGVDFDVVHTRASLHAVQLAWEAPQQGYSTVLAVGGDGIVHEAMNGLLRASNEGETIALGIIPMGSGNDFNKMLPPALKIGGKRDDWHDAIPRIVRGETQLMDVGRINGDNPAPGHPHPHYFDNGTSVGFGARVAQECKNVPSFLTGTGMYLAAVMRILANYSIPRLRLTLADGTIIDQPSTMTAVANGRCFGAAFWLTPNADSADGVFDVFISKGLGRAGILAIIPRLMNGTHLNHWAVKIVRSTRVVIDSQAPLVVEADGELPFFDAHHLEIDILPRRLRMIV